MMWRIGVVLLLTVLPLIPGCQKACKPGEDVDCWISALKDPQQAMKAVENLKQIGDKKAEPALIDLFRASTNEPGIREQIAEIFNKWGSRAAVKPMIDALDFTVGANKDGRKAKRTNRANQKIASALGAIGDPSASPPLLGLVKTTKEPNVNRAAIRALGKLKAKDAVGDLLKMIEDTTTDQIIRNNAIFALGEIGEPQTVPALVLALYRNKALSFVQAKLALVKIGEPAIALLVKTMNGENTEAKRITEENVEIMEGALEGNAAQVLGDIGSPKAGDALMAMAEKVGKWEDETSRLLVMTRLINALGMIGDARAAKVILATAEKGFWDVRTVCATAINNLSDRGVIPGLLKIINKGGHPTNRSPLIEAIGNLGTDEQLPILKQMLETEKDATLQPVVKDSISRLEAYAQCKQDMNCWIGKLSEKNVAVRDKAVYELGRIGDVRAIDALTKIVGDESENVRYGLIWAFDRLKSKKAIAAIDNQMEKEKGSARFSKVNNDYQLLLARLGRTGS